MEPLKVKEILCLLYSALLFISGILLIGFSVVIFCKLFYYFKFVNSGPIILLFILGFVHLFLTWLGIRGPSKEHDFHIILFIVISIILLLIECSIGIWSMVKWGKINPEMVEWDPIDNKQKCCSLMNVNNNLQCCDKTSYITCSDTFEPDCKKALASKLKIRVLEAALMGFISCILQCFGIFVFSIFLRNLRKNRAARNVRRLAMQRRFSRENGAAPPVIPATP